MQTPGSGGALPFFALALGWSWLFWAAAVGWSDEPTRSPLFLIGGVGPVVAAVALTYLREPREARRAFWARAFDPRRLHWPWPAVALLLHPALVALAFGADVALGGSLPPLDPRARSLPALASLAFFVLWFGPLPEELGWRGFALDRLQARTSALRASLALGCVWALWHVPLFFVPGTYQAGLGAGSLRCWIFLLSLIPLSVLITWVYNHTARSTLSAILIHYSGNLCGELLPKSNRVAGLELGFLSLAALIAVAACGGRRLAAPRD